MLGIRLIGFASERNRKIVFCATLDFLGGKSNRWTRSHVDLAEVVSLIWFLHGFFRVSLNI